VVAEFEAAQSSGTSQRAFAKEQGVPRTTLQHWLARKAGLDADPALIAFFESPVGLAFLHRLVVALLLVFCQLGPCGIRLVCQFLKLSGLSAFVASAYGSQQAVASAMEREIVAFGEQERARLRAGMAPTVISVAEDETFHPEICLVAIDLKSDFILVEGYHAQRDAATWDAAVAEATADLPVTIVQSVSDEAAGIVAHVEQSLGAHHAPDLFHVQHELGKATALPLAAQTTQPKTDLERAEAATAKLEARRDDYDSGKRPPGRRPDFEKRIAVARAAQAQARAVWEAACARCQTVRDAIRALGEIYHPYDLASGEIRSPEAARAAFDTQFANIDTVATAAKLGAACLKRIDKARRVVPKMVATLAFYHSTVNTTVAALALPPEAAYVVLHLLIPAFYLQRVAGKARTAAERAAHQALADSLMARARAPDGPLASLAPALLDRVLRVAADCAALFHRASSCVEGRNGQLALRYHCLHRLSTRKLAALTTLHNYFIRRQDGTTAAERFFGAPPADLFQYLLDHLNVPARPAKSRSATLPLAA
jgi:hypothetical protein